VRAVRSVYPALYDEWRRVAKGQVGRADARGFIADIWYEIPPP
jgi:hypothetical protein